MKTKEKIFLMLLLLILLITLFLYVIFSITDSYATSASGKKQNVKISNAKEPNIYQIICNNTGEKQEEQIETKEEPLEFITKYRINEELPKGTLQVVQEGREGVQQVSIKKIFQDGQLIEEKQVGTKVIKASVNKIVEIGGAKYSSDYKVKNGDKIYTTADRVEVMLEANPSSNKVTTLDRNVELEVVDSTEDWYRVIQGANVGWVKKESTTFINPNEKYDENKYGKSKEDLLKELGFNMDLTKPSGLTLEQFKKILTDDKDVNKVFEQNAEFFYYIEKQYKINGVFVAAIGIHESAWGTSKISKDKHNLFGYGAYDSSPYASAYEFSEYSEGIDLIARVLTKYYLNPSGTEIFNSEKAVGTYYNGPTFTGVNTRYATDKNWANAVYKHMQNLYNKL